MLSKVIGDATNSVLNAVQYNEAQARAAYFNIFQYLAAQEKSAGGHGWKPSKTGLHLRMAPLHKGWSMWVSAEGIDKFCLEGKDAITVENLNSNLNFNVCGPLTSPGSSPP